ncbi:MULTISPECIES: DUF4190 domain-containing protein [unclassified Streptomyces]|uniref:DUF4190 domain-containing protein n=1 Tax=unclassified Streptomyces TaxID=2593676 RepID=UPI002E34919C|nr:MULTISPECIES: DUF4190 domain-containing protein [unclassified Streptomyces]WUC64389.1 DUF4190 domain-containing protein [Streptomyces sp. NBC_00539]
MTEQQSPEPRDPWAPPPPGGAPGGPGAHEHPTVSQTPGADSPPPAYGYPAPPAYGYPAPPAPGGYAHPGPPTPPAQPGYGAYPGYAPGYQGYAPGYPGYPHAQPSNGFGIAALVLGILAIVACPTMIGSVMFGITAVVFGALGRGKARRGEATNGGVALAGLICGAVGIVIGAALTLLLLFSPGPFFGPGSGDGDYHGPSSDSQVQEKI